MPTSAEPRPAFGADCFSAGLRLASDDARIAALRTEGWICSAPASRRTGHGDGEHVEQNEGHHRTDEHQAPQPDYKSQRQHEERNDREQKECPERQRLIRRGYAQTAPTTAVRVASITNGSDAPRIVRAIVAFVLGPIIHGE